MDTHDGTDVAGEIAATGGDGEVLGGVEAVGVNHEVAVVAVDCGRLAAVAAIEELGQGLALAEVDVAHVEPGSVAGDDGGVRLGDKVGTRRRLQLRLGLGLGVGAVAIDCLCVGTSAVVVAAAVAIAIAGAGLVLGGVVNAAHVLVLVAIGIVGIGPRSCGRVERISGRRSGCRGRGRGRGGRGGRVFGHGRVCEAV